MFIDTSGLLCSLDERDFRHEAAVAYLRSARLRITHSYVLAELVALVHSRKFSHEVTLGFVAELFDDATVEIIWIDEIQTRQAVNFLRERLDKEWSLCDAVSFILMDEMRVVEALTTDHHFEQAGFVRLLNI